MGKRKSKNTNTKKKSVSNDRTTNEPSDEMLENLDILMNMDLLEEQDVWGELADSPKEDNDNNSEESI